MSIDLSPLERDVLRAIKDGQHTPADIYNQLRPFHTDLTSIVGAAKFLRRTGLIERYYPRQRGVHFNITGAGEDQLVRDDQLRLDGMPAAVRAAAGGWGG